MELTIKNLPATYKPYIVARVVDDDLWYWGSWDDEERAHAVANEIGGIVVYGEEL